MKKIYNFSAGPACLPQQAITSSIESIKNFKQSGMSLLEMSHRSVQVVDLFEETTNNIIELLNIPKNYRVLWLQGGASLQFSMVPMNLLPLAGSADYIDTGSWSAKAITECEKFGKANVIGSSKDSTYSYIPKDLQISSNSSYLHITSNNTIYGTQYKKFPDVINKNGFLVADMSSDILSRPLNLNDFGLIYAGAQKNIGIAGVTLVILREDIIKSSHQTLPPMLDYKIHIKKDSMFNTPPVFCVYVVNETLKWINKLGGLESIESMNNTKAELLYNEIDENKLFRCPVSYEDRSNMNVVFTFSDQSKNDNDFLDFCSKRGLNTLKGHRSVGGFRASIYNAMPIQGVKELTKAMREYSKK